MTRESRDCLCSDLHWLHVGVFNHIRSQVTVNFWGSCKTDGGTHAWEARESRDGWELRSLSNYSAAAAGSIVSANDRFFGGLICSVLGFLWGILLYLVRIVRSSYFFKDFAIKRRQRYRCLMFECSRLCIYPESTPRFSGWDSRTFAPDQNPQPRNPNIPPSNQIILTCCSSSQINTFSILNVATTGLYFLKIKANQIWLFNKLLP